MNSTPANQSETSQQSETYNLPASPAGRQPTTNNPTSPPFHNSKLPFIVAGIITVSLVVIGAYFLAKSQNNQKTSNISPSPYPSSSPTPDTTVNWKTYTNSQLKFEIRYPSNWSIIEDIGPLEKQINIVRFSSHNSDFENDALTLFIDTVVKNVSLESLKNNLDNPKYISIGNIQGIKGLDKDYIKENKFVYIAYFINNNILYTLSSGNILNKNMLPLFDQILSTFKFTSQDQTTSLKLTPT